MTTCLKKFFYGSADAEVNNKELQIVAFGILLIFYGIFAMAFALMRGHPSDMLWVCYISMFFIGIASLRKNSFVIAGFLNILLVPLIIWNIDFLVQLITGEQFLGLSNFFASKVLVSRFVSISHFFSVPLTLYLLYLIGLRRRDSWKLSIPILFILGIVSPIFTSPIENVNCALRSCVSFLGGDYYQAQWIFVLSVMTLITGLIINRFSIFFAQN